MNILMEDRLEYFYNNYPSLDKDVVKKHFYINECKFCSHPQEKRDIEIHKSILEGTKQNTSLDKSSANPLDKSLDKSSANPLDKSLDKSLDKDCKIGVLKKEKKTLRNLVGKFNIKKKYKRMFSNRVDISDE